MPRAHMTLLQVGPSGKKILKMCPPSLMGQVREVLGSCIFTPSAPTHQPDLNAAANDITHEDDNSGTVSKTHQTYLPRDLTTGRWWCRDARGVRGSRLLHDASTANHSARVDGLAFQFAVSPPRACNDTLNTLRRRVPLLPPLVLR